MARSRMIDVTQTCSHQLEAEESYLVNPILGVRLFDKGMQ